MLLPAPAAEAAGEVTDAQLQEYFDAHASEYTSPETLALEYLELDSSKLEVPVAADAAPAAQ